LEGLKDCDAAAQDWDKAELRIQARANEGRSEAQKGNQNARKTGFSSHIPKEHYRSQGQRLLEISEHTISVRTDSRQSTNAGSKAKSELAGTNRGAVQIPAHDPAPQLA